MAPDGYVIGLTGGIGSGKSTVAGLFAQYGVAQVDTDAIAHALTAPGGAAMGLIRVAFGDGVVSADGALDRAAMRDRVFGAPLEKARLEAILHPLIRATARRAVADAARAGPPYVLLSVPLLFESAGFRDDVQRTLTVDCPTDVQRQRVRERPGMSEAVIARIMAAQLPRPLRLQLADDVVVNSTDRAALESRVGVLHQRYLGLARAHQAARAGGAEFVNTAPIRHNSASPGPRP